MRRITAILMTALVSLALWGTDSPEIRRLEQVLRSPRPPVEQYSARDAFARQQAEAAARLLRLGRAGALWPLLQHRADPSVRSYIIHQMGTTDASLVRKRLESEREVSARRALVLALGEFGAEQITASQREALVPMLLRWYRHHPDPGLHAAIEWLLQRPRLAARQLDWNQDEALTSIQRELAGRAHEGRAWYLTRDGQTMAVMRGPVEFGMGSPAPEPGRTADEVLRRVRIPRSFAIASKEVTIAQFRRFLEANPGIRQRHAYPGSPARMSQVLRQFSPEDDGPQIAVTWYEAAMYCNWLSQQEGIPESEWVYPRNLEDIQSGMEMPKDYLRRTGYRLPTEAEWEYAARAGSTTPRFYGISDRLLREYAWYSAAPPRKKDDPVDPNDPQRTAPVGQLKPNDFGLFDVYGNVWEWLQDRRQEYAAGEGVAEDREDAVLTVTDDEARTRRGGSFSYGAEVMRSAHRGSHNYFPQQRRDNVGFRVARTYP